MSPETGPPPLTERGRERLDSLRSLLSEDPQVAIEGARELLVECDAPDLLGRIWSLIGRGHSALDQYSEALDAFTRARDDYREAGETELELSALQLAARSARQLGMYDLAAGTLDEALELAQGLDDPDAEAETLNLQAGTLNSLGKYVEALHRLEEALRISSGHGLKERQTSILSNIGILHLQLGDYARALESLHSAYDLIKATQPGSRGEAATLITLGSVYEEMGELERAGELLAQAREVGSSIGDKSVQAASLNHLASLRASAKDWPAARDLYQQALQLARQIGDRSYEIDNLDGLGQVHAALEEYDIAAEVHGEALAIAREIGDREGENDALLNLGRGYMAIGRPADAVPLLQQGLDLAKELERRRALYEVHELLSVASEQTGDLDAALHHHREFYRVEKEVFNEENEERVRRLTVQFELGQARSEAAAFRERTRLAQEAQEAAEAMVRERTRELEEAQLEIVTRLAIAAEYRDDETGEHTWRVGRSASAIARELEWPDAEVRLISAAARLHDVGKIGIRDAVLLKPDKLSDDEYEMMRRHTLIGGRILSGGHSRLLRMAEEIAFAHHERWDGKGYPLGLAGDEIPMSARIVAVADVLDALTHSRPYKRPWPITEALAEIRRYGGHQFDPKVVEACMRVFGDDGSRVPVDEEPGPDSVRAAEMLPSTLKLKDRLEQVLAERTRELASARRDAEDAARKMQMMAFSDPLTSLGNRRAFEVDLDAEVTRAKRHGDRVAVLNIDLDDLKVVNDLEGHERGDELLRVFARAIGEELSELGRIYRTGGDEFAVILIHMSRPEMDRALEQLKRAQERVWSAGFSSVAASAGIAVLPDEAGSAAELMRLSDQRMYEDKLARKESPTSN